MIQGSFKVFQGSCKGVSRMCQGSFFCNFVVAWHSLQILTQKEGLFTAESFSTLETRMFANTLRFNQDMRVLCLKKNDFKKFQKRNVFEPKKL